MGAYLCCIILVALVPAVWVLVVWGMVAVVVWALAVWGMVQALISPPFVDRISLTNPDFFTL